MKDKIKLPEGWVIDPENSTDTEIAIKQKEKSKALTWEKIQKKNMENEMYQFYLTAQGVICPTNAGDDLIENSKTHLPSLKIAEKIRALCQMHVIAEYYNRVYANGWVADWKDSDQFKWYMSWDNDVDVIVTASLYSLSDTFPVFASKELIQMAYENNKEIFETALKP